MLQAGASMRSNSSKVRAVASSRATVRPVPPLIGLERGDRERSLPLADGLCLEVAAMLVGPAGGSSSR